MPKVKRQSAALKAARKKQRNAAAVASSNVGPISSSRPTLEHIEDENGSAATACGSTVTAVRQNTNAEMKSASKYLAGMSFLRYRRIKMRQRYGNPDFRTEWREKMRQRYLNPEFRTDWREKMRQRYLNPEFRTDWREKMRQRYLNPEFRSDWREKMRQRYLNPEFRTEWGEKMKQAMARSYGNPDFRKEKTQKMRQKYANPEFRNEKTEKMRQRYANPKFRNEKKLKMRQTQRMKAADATEQQRVQQRQRVRTSKANRAAAMDPVYTFHSLIEQGPTYTCVCCHRHLYKQSVVQFVQSKYKQEHQELLTQMVSAFGGDDSKLYICKTCKLYVIRGHIPPQAAINGLLLDEIPKQLDLTELEVALVAQRVLFMKLFALPRGQQHCIHGAVVNVPSTISTVVTALPLTPSQAGLIPLKLKRRMRYKGYMMYELIRPKLVLRAVQWLVENNPLYCGISVDRNWNEASVLEDEQAWKGMTGSITDNIRSDTQHCSDVEPSSSNDSSSSDSDDDVLVNKVRGLKYGTALQPRDPQYAATELSVAPCEGQSPLDFMLDDNVELLAFPNKFPYGSGGVIDERSVALTPKKYYIQRVLNRDKRFASDVGYLFYAQYVCEMRQLRSNITVAMRMTAGQMSARTVSDAEQLRQLIKNDNAFQFLQNIRGSPAYFQRAIRQLIAMVSQLSCPHFFLTLSAADMSWPELFKIIALQNGRVLTDDDVATMKYEEKATMLRKDPVLTARHFDYRLRTFLSQIIVRAATLGPIREYFYRIEFQMRGSPHAHLLIWTLDGPTDMAAASASDIEEYFASKVTAQLPAESDELHSLVGRVQRHAHSVACRKGKNKSSCRFNFPRPPSDRNILAMPPSAEENTTAMREWRADIITRVFKAIDELGEVGDCTATTLDDVLAQLGISSDDYHKALSISIRGRCLILKRRLCDININNYNRTIMAAWRANMDIQPVLDAYACIMYIVSYMSKDEREMSEILRVAKKEHADKDVRTQMKKIGSVFLTHREVSAQEAVFRLLGMSMLSCTVKRVFVPTDFPQNRIRILKASRDLEALDPDSEDVYMAGLLQRYIARPRLLDSMCLADFAVQYDVCYRSKHNQQGSDGDTIDVQPSDEQRDDDASDETITLSNRMGKMRRRKNRAILMTHKFSVDKEPEKYYHSELMLFTAWRDEEADLRRDFDTYSEAYAGMKDDIALVRKRFYRETDAVSDAVDKLIDHGPPVSAWDDIASEQRHENLVCEQEGALPETFVDCDDDEILNTTFVDFTAADAKASGLNTEYVCLLSDDDFLALTRSLNYGQQVVFQHVLDWCRAKKQSDKIPPFHIFCTGGAGVGKSHLIHAIVQMVNRELHNAGDSPDDIIVLLTAPTGTAAYNIGGSTIHSSFLLNACGSSRFDTLSAEKLSTLRNKYAKLQVLVIDEISMVGANLLQRIHSRLAAITGIPTAAPFAGISVLAVGDFQQLSPVGEAAVYKPARGGCLSLADLWMSNFRVFTLTEIMRQQSDTTFAQMLSRLRLGKQTSADIALLQSRQIDPDDTTHDTEPHIFSLNVDVDSYNNRHLSALSNKLVAIAAVDKWPSDWKDRSDVDTEKKSGLATVLYLKVGCRCMLQRNYETSIGLYNGSLATVVGFRPHSATIPNDILLVFDNERLKKIAIERYPTLGGAFPIERVEARIPLGRRRNSVIEATRLQFPLKLAFAFTVHKIQGQTLSSAVVSLRGHFGPGQAYVALSRCKTLDNLYITDFDTKCLKVNRSGLRAYETMMEELPLAIPHEIWLMNSTDPFKLALLNTRSLQRHINDIKNSIYMRACNVAVYTESRLRPNMTLDELDDCSVFSATASQESNYVGGVTTVVSSKCNAKLVQSVSKKHFQMTVVEVECRQIRVNVVALYRSPAQSMTQFRRCINLYVKPQLSSAATPSLVVGDFNVDARQTTVIDDTTQHVKTTTHVDGAILDHVYWTGQTDWLRTDVISCHWSDHSIVAVTIADTQTATDFEHVASSSHQKSTTVPAVTVTPADSQAATDLEHVLPTSSSCHKLATVPTVTTRRAASRTTSTVARDNVSTFCSFLDSALGPHRMQLDIDVAVKELIHQHGLRTCSVPGSGHCILYSWAGATGVSVTQIKEILRNEYHANVARYTNAGVSASELQRYLNSKNYRLDSVDAVVDMLANATGVVAFIIGQKYDYSDARNIKPIRNKTEVRRISSVVSGNHRNSILLLKSGEHYNYLK